MIIAIDDDDACNELVTTFYKALCISFFHKCVTLPNSFCSYFTHQLMNYTEYVTKTFNETFSESQKEAD
jgi:hypothetical protein